MHFILPHNNTIRISIDDDGVNNDYDNNNNINLNKMN